MNSRNDGSFGINPRGIDASNIFYVLDDTKSSVAATYLIRLWQRKGLWCGLSLKEIEEFYNERNYHGFHFGKLIEKHWVIIKGDKCYATADLVLECSAAQVPFQKEDSRDPQSHQKAIAA